MKKQAIARDYGTAELSKRFTIVPKLGNGSYHGKVLDDTEIDRLLLNDVIDATEHSILEALHFRLRKASFNSLRSPDYNSTIHSDPQLIANKKLDAVASAVGLIADMDRTLGREKRSALIKLVTEETRWPYGNHDLRTAISSLQSIMTSRRV